MPPARGSKGKSSSSTHSTSKDHVARNSLQSPSKREALTATPIKGASTRNVRITQNQKQALIDNLQLEITERARKMRAQYALQAQGLKTRLEIRVHRIPAYLRSTTVGELLEKYSEQANIKPAPSVRVVSPTKPTQGSKRKSDEAFDNEAGDALHSAKTKRSRPVDSEPASDTHMARGGVRRVPSSDVLSPKSNNSQRIRPSPFKSTISPTKSNIGRVASPLKPSTMAQTATSAAKVTEKPAGKVKASNPRVASKEKGTTTGTNTKQTRQKRAPPSRQVDEDAANAEKRASNVSDAASSSAGTTIVRKTKKPATTSAMSTVTKGKVAGARAKFEGIAGTGKKIAPTKPVAAPSTGGIVKGGRTLRKRA